MGAVKENLGNDAGVTALYLKNQGKSNSPGATFIYQGRSKGLIKRQKHCWVSPYMDCFKMWASHLLLILTTQVNTRLSQENSLSNAYFRPFNHLFIDQFIENLD